MTDISITRTNDKSTITFTDPYTSQNTTVELNTPDLYALLKEVNTHINEDLQQLSYLLNADDIIDNVKRDAHEPIFSNESRAMFTKFLQQNPEDLYKQASDKLNRITCDPDFNINDTFDDISGAASISILI